MVVVSDASKLAHVVLCNWNLVKTSRALLKKKTIGLRSVLWFGWWNSPAGNPSPVFSVCSSFVANVCVDDVEFYAIWLMKKGHNTEPM